MQELADLLAREHVQLEFLLFKTIELHQLLRAGETRFLRWAASELSRAADRVRECEDRRHALVAEQCAIVGIRPAWASLGALTDHACEPWRTIFSDHGSDMAQLVIEVESNRQAAREIAGASGHSVIDALDQMYRPTASALPSQRDDRGSVILPDSLS
jgi:hypothetical protein